MLRTKMSVLCFAIDKQDKTSFQIEMYDRLEISIIFSFCICKTLSPKNCIKYASNNYCQPPPGCESSLFSNLFLNIGNKE